MASRVLMADVSGGGYGLEGGGGLGQQRDDGGGCEIMRER